MNQTPNTGHWLRGDLKAYVDGEMPLWRQRVAAWHLRRCASCRGEADWLKRMSGNFAEWENTPDYSPRPELRARILACLPAESPQQLANMESVLKPRTSYTSTLRPTLAFGSLAAIALLMGGAFAMRLHPSANPTANTPALPNTVPIAKNGAEPTVAPAADNPYRVVSIFTAPKNSFDGAKTAAMSAAGSPGNELARPSVVETSAAPETTANASANDAASPAPSDEVYTDPTSREAERRASLAIGKMLNARHQQRLANAKHAPLSQPHSNPANPAAPPAGPQIALAVTNISEARQQLQQWAETAGARMRVMAEKGNAPAVVTANGAPLPAGILLEMRVPARIADSLQTHLSQIGTPLPQVGAGVKNPHALTMQESGGAAGQAPVLPPPSNAIARPANGNTFVTVRVRLLSGDTLIQP